MSAVSEYCEYWVDFSKGAKSIKEQLDIQHKLYEKAVAEVKVIMESSEILNKGGVLCHKK